LNEAQTTQLLSLISVIDGRHIDLIVVRAWMDVLGDLPQWAVADALTKFRRDQPGVWLEPGHLYKMAHPVVVANRQAQEQATLMRFQPEPISRDTRMDEKHRELLREYDAFNQRSMVTGMSDEVFQTGMLDIRRRWYTVMGLTPPAELGSNV